MKNVLPKVAISNEFTQGCLESFKFAKTNLTQRLHSLSLQLPTTQNKITLLLPGGGFMPGLYPLCQHIKKQNPHINTINVSLVDPNELVTVANIKSIYASAVAKQLFADAKSIAINQDKALIIFELNSFKIIIKVANMRLDTYKEKHQDTKFDVIMIENPMIQPWPLVSLGCCSSLKSLIMLRDSLGELRGFSKKNKTWILLTTHFIPELIQGIALLSTKYKLSDRNIKRIYSTVVPYHTSKNLPYQYNLFLGKYRGVKKNALCQRENHDVCLTFSMCSTLLLMILSHAQGNQHNLPLYVSPLLFMGYIPPNLKGSIFALGLVMLQLAACLHCAYDTHEKYHPSCKP